MSTAASTASAPRQDLLVAIALVGVLALTVVPLPSALLDLLLATSLCLAVLVFLVAMYIERPLDFSAFPSLLLFLTMFRLALNVASTRLILMNGENGEAAAGSVIRAFGSFAVGGNFVVGAVVFLILVIVNFIVITKGAERISEVGARFTLDSMPGKQMAIDADLGAGLITEKEARRRRKEVSAEADFHGSMDGASKFVRGDAVAGLLITGINILGGLLIGVAQQGMGWGEALSNYTILSIGDGLVSQIPALLVSTGSALLISRSSEGSLGSALGSQLLSSWRPMAIAAGVLFLAGSLPGMPHVAFYSMAGIAGYAAHRARKKAMTAAAVTTGEDGAPAPDSDSAEGQRAEIEAMLPVDLLSLEVGLELLPLVSADQGGELLGRIAGLRKQLARELGVLVPPVHVRDDLRMKPGSYRILISGVSVAEGEVRASRLLAIDPSGSGTRGLAGENVVEPTFGLPAMWIAKSERNRAESAGCTVVNASAVIATHLTETVRRNAGDLLGRREAQELLDVAGRQHGKVIEELIPHLMSLGDVIKVLRNLLREGVSIRDLRTILETLADCASVTKDTDELTEHVRQRLARRISRDNLDDAGRLSAMVLDPRAEELFRSGGAQDPRGLTRLTDELEKQTRKAVERDDAPLLVVAPDIRRSVAMVAARHVPGLSVMSYREVDPAIPFLTRTVITADGSRA